eukprot:SAG22_NODE_2094_length_3020_cov_2.981171_1_plen_303_part_10
MSKKVLAAVKLAGSGSRESHKTQWDFYTNAVCGTDEDGVQVRRTVLDRLEVVWRELKWEIYCEAEIWASSMSFWVRAACSLFAVVVCHYVHYIGQYVFLWIFMEEPTARIDLLPPVHVTYSTEALRPKHELAVVAAGMLANLADLVFLVMACTVSVFLYDGIHPLISHFVDAFVLFTFVSPFVIALIDVCRLNWSGDMFKLFSIYDESDGDGAIGLLITACAYIMLELLTGVLCYFYFIYVHMNGRVRDSVLRIEASEAEMVCPGDLEVSYDELAHLCAVDGWRKGGAHRVVTTTEHSKMVHD